MLTSFDVLIVPLNKVGELKVKMYFFPLFFNLKLGVGGTIHEDLLVPN